MLAHLLDLEHPLYWTVDGVLSEAECRDLIERIDNGNPEVATVNAPKGHVLDTSIRNNQRVIFDDEELAKSLFDRVRPHLPETLNGMQVAGANERFRCYRYHPGQVFKAHYDGSFQRSETERSLLTFMVYLNEVERGGQTTFLELDAAIEPRAGRALLFQHPVLHEGSTVEAGVKYAIRSDIMYRAAELD